MQAETHSGRPARMKTSEAEAQAESELTFVNSFPREIRTLAGAEDGALLTQQTAANLHAGPGDTIRIRRAGQPPLTVAVP